MMSPRRTFAASSMNLPCKSGPTRMTPELRDLLALHLVPGIGPRLTAALLERFGSPRAVFQAPAEELRQVQHIGEKLADNLCRRFEKTDLDAEIDLIERHGVSLVPLNSPEYPGALAT